MIGGFAGGTFSSKVGKSLVSKDEVALWKIKYHCRIMVSMISNHTRRTTNGMVLVDVRCFLKLAGKAGPYPCTTRTARNPADYSIYVEINVISAEPRLQPMTIKSKL